MQLIFVYGTLKRGNGLHYILEEVEFVGEAITFEPIFKMFCNGAYPYVSNVGGGGYRIIGELFKVSDKTLIELDWAEGHPTHYRRIDAEFMLADGSMVAGQLYILNRPVNVEKEITSGCWFPPTLVKHGKNRKSRRKKFDNLATVW